MKLARDSFFYYDYAGGTYYSVKLCWFFNCSEELEELVWTNGEVVEWRIHGSHDSEGKWDEYSCYC